MLTELLRRTAMKHFDQEGIKYTVTSDEKTILITIGSPEGAVHTAVSHFGDLSFLVITVRDFVSFPDARAAEALTLCNEFNMGMAGTFHMDQDNDITYVYEWVATENAGPDDFRAMLRIFLLTYASVYRLFMTVRWAKVTIGEAKTMLACGEHRDDGNDDDEGDTPPLNDKATGEVCQIIEATAFDSPDEDGTDEDGEDDDSPEEDTSKE